MYRAFQDLCAVLVIAMRWCGFLPVYFADNFMIYFAIPNQALDTPAVKTPVL